MGVSQQREWYSNAFWWVASNEIKQAPEKTGKNQLTFFLKCSGGIRNNGFISCDCAFAARQWCTVLALPSRSLLINPYVLSLRTKGCNDGTHKNDPSPFSRLMANTTVCGVCLWATNQKEEWQRSPDLCNSFARKCTPPSLFLIWSYTLILHFYVLNVLYCTLLYLSALYVYYVYIDLQLAGIKRSFKGFSTYQLNRLSMA